MEVKYFKNYPINQNLIDLFKGTWKSKFPDWLSVDAGKVNFYEKDSRIEWALSHLKGPFFEYDVLEVGPFEAYNTYQLASRGPKSLISIEFNNVSFLKCLVVKELFGYKAKLLLGDSFQYLRDSINYFDLVWLSGVLYHLTDPVDYINALSRKCDSVFIWTHFYDADAIKNCEGADLFEPLEIETVEYRGEDYTYFRRLYKHAPKIKQSFSGGAEDHAYWMTFDDICKCLNQAGFNNIIERGKNMKHPMGPTVSLIASKNNFL